MFHPHLLILAASVFMHVMIRPVMGKPQYITATFPDMAACRMAIDEIVAAASLDEISSTCTKRYTA